MRNAAILACVLILVATGCGGENASDNTGEQDAATEDQRTAPVDVASTETSETTGANSPAGGGNNTSGGTILRIRTSGGEAVEVQVEVADDEAERAKGLMDRRSLPENAGMLFAYNNERTLSFWMRDTYIPLSIAYADRDGRIVDIQDMEPLDDEPPSYVSAEPARYALEVNQGFFEQRGVEVGDTMEVPEELR